MSLEKISIEKKNPIHFRNQRKKAVASCRMKIKTVNSNQEAQILVNKKPFFDYFRSVHSKALRVMELNEYTSQVETFFIKAAGGGISSQLEAVISSIAKAITSLAPDVKKALKEKRLYKHDPRQHERNKPGLVKRRKGTPYRKR